jgi:hypothetical protein
VEVYEPTVYVMMREITQSTATMLGLRLRLRLNESGSVSGQKPEFRRLAALRLDGLMILPGKQQRTRERLVVAKCAGEF